MCALQFIYWDANLTAKDICEFIRIGGICVDENERAPESIVSVRHTQRITTKSDFLFQISRADNWFSNTAECFRNERRLLVTRVFIRSCKCVSSERFDINCTIDYRFKRDGNEFDTITRIARNPVWSLFNYFHTRINRSRPKYISSRNASWFKTVARFRRVQQKPRRLSKSVRSPGGSHRYTHTVV